MRAGGRKLCAQCGVSFQPYRESNKFCSKTCYWHGKRKPDLPVQTCLQCGIAKPIDEFGLFTAASNGKRAICKLCHRLRVKKDADRHPDVIRDRQHDWYYNKDGRKWSIDSFRKKHYGVSAVEYQAMLLAQKGVCAICGMPETRMHGDNVRSLSVDHDAETGKVRGLLCGACNTGIGQLRHDRTILEAAIDYLERSKETEMSIANQLD